MSEKISFSAMRGARYSMSLRSFKTRYCRHAMLTFSSFGEFVREVSTCDKSNKVVKAYL